MKRLRSYGLLLSTLLLAQGCAYFQKQPEADTPEAAAESAYQLCGSCHGPRDIKVDLMAPSIAGQKEAYLAGALRAYRDKSRLAPEMNSITQSFTDRDIANLAHYFAKLEWNR
ncbi:MAG: cytochrome c [Methylococcus sp.]|nr:cytochrome c [Methylococcus sp.]